MNVALFKPRGFRSAAFALLAIALGAPAAHAHHSAARYDARKQVTVHGTVTRYDWANPHVYIYVQQATAAGEKIEWEIEGQPPTLMRRLGWSAETLRIGDSVTVTGSASRSPTSKSMLPTSIQRGEQVLLGKGMPQPTVLADAPTGKAKSIEGLWMTQLDAQLLAQFAYPMRSKLTEAGTAAVKQFSEKTMHPGINCVPFATPTSMIVPDQKRITVSGDVIRIEGEFEGAARTVHMSLATHDGAIPSIQGHSIGKWAGTTLIVDTTHFAYHRIGSGMGLPSGPGKHLVERFTLNADGASLTYSFELSDPQYLAQPKSGQVQWSFTPYGTFATEKCNMENARRFTKDD